MNIEVLKKEFQEKISAGISLSSAGLSRYFIEHPFTFDDGDHFVIILKNIGDNWFLTDEGHTIMHLSYEEIDLDKGNYGEIIDKTITAFSLENREGELVLPIPDLLFGDALYSYIQALIKIADIKYLERERIASLFLQEFRSYISENIPENRRVFDYYSHDLDPQRIYPIDCRFETKSKPLFIFAINNDSKCQAATNIVYWWERQMGNFDVMAIHENQEALNRRNLARFSDVCGKQFSSLYGNKDRIKAYIDEHLNGGG